MNQYEEARYAFAMTGVKPSNVDLALSRLQAVLDDLYLQVSADTSPIASYDLQRLKYSIKLRSQFQSQDHVTERVKLLTDIEDLESTMRYLRKVQSRYAFSTESNTLTGDMGEGVVSANVVSKHENLTDIAGQQDDKEVAGFTSNSNQGQKNLLDVDEFFSRPVPLGSYPLLQAADINYRINVWDLYSLDPSVRAKLRNYAYLRGNLHVRISISGTPFHYGKMLVSYQPLWARNETLKNQLLAAAAEPSWRRLLLNYLSQAPGAVVMDVRENQPVDIVCPFISTKPMHRLFNTSAVALGDTTSYDDLLGAGMLHFYSLTNIESVSTTASDVDAYIYAWLTDVELGCPTGTVITVSTESKVLNDERFVGPVEKIATRSAQVAKVLTNIPWLSPFATASRMFLEGVADVSSIFGWSKPTVEAAPHHIKAYPFTNGSQVIGYDTTMRITLDPRQELTVDPRVLGSAEDEMSFAHICSRETWYDEFFWANEDTPMGAPIQFYAVHPSLMTKIVTAAKWYMQPTALAYAAAPFYWWRGDITFRIEVVCSQFHRGKLVVWYEPNVSQRALINLDLETNKQYMKVIDIQETQSVDFCVNWAFPRAWARTISLTEQKFLADSNLENLSHACNGYIGITPLTRLQSPDDSGVYVNVYVRSENMEFNVLTDTRLPTERFDASTESKTLSPVEVTCYDLNESTADTSRIAEEHFGERPLSFRSILKRFTTTAQVSTVSAGTAPNTYLALGPIIPILMPQFNLAMVSTDFVSLFSYMRYAYVGLRGGVRKRFHMRSGNKPSGTDQINVSLRNPTSTPIASMTVSSGTDTNANFVQGTVTFMPLTNGGVEAEFPFYTNNLFLISFAADLVGTNANNDMDTSWSRHFQMGVDSSDAAGITFRLYENTATGEDFSFLRFQGAPYFSLAL